MNLFAGPIGRGKEPQRIRDGGTGGDSAETARASLDVPSLSGDNVFGGTNEFGGAVSFQGVVNIDDALTVTGGLDASGDPVTATTVNTMDLTATGTVRAAGVRTAYAAKTSGYTLTAADCVVDCTSGTFTVTLPAAATAGAGRLYVVKNSGAGVITLDGDGAETIDGAATLALAATQVARLVCTGGAWITV